MNTQPIEILVVDDEEGILDVTEGYFSRKGYKVYTAGNGAQALEVVKEKKISCIFTDINMPVMDGLELAEQVRHLENTLPVVVMTGYPSLENSIATLKNGVVDYLIKPVNLEQMEMTLRRVLRERELLVENLILKEEVERKERLEQLNNELIARVKDVNTLNRIMEDFSSTDSTHGVYDKVVDLGVEELEADKVFFHFYAEQEHSLIMITQASKDVVFPMDASAFDKDIPAKTREYIIGIIEADDKPSLIQDSLNNRQIDDNINSCMVVPLKIRDQIFGVASAFIFSPGRFFDEKDIYYMTFITQKAASAIENIALYGNIIENLVSTLRAFVTALEARDSYTREHSTRVAEFAYAIAEYMGCTQEELEIIDFAGSLHDIGKIGIPDDILLKPGKLNDEEYEKIKEHPRIGADIVGKLGVWDREVEIIRCHHERFDGKGYPGGLKGEEIPKLARIMSVADCFDAMASDRSYRKRMDTDLVYQIIRRNSGSQFDPKVVEAFFQIADQELFHDL